MLERPTTQSLVAIEHLLTRITAATHGGAYPAGGPRADDDDWRGAAEHASRHAGDSGNADLFSNLLGALGNKKQQLENDDIDEDGQYLTSSTHFEILYTIKGSTDSLRNNKMLSKSTRSTSRARMTMTTPMIDQWAPLLPCRRSSCSQAARAEMMLYVYLYNDCQSW